MIKLIACDLDGTLSNHKSHLPKENVETLFNLSKKYKLLMVGAGNCHRIFDQMEKFPIDIIGNYGMQFFIYDKTANDITPKENACIFCDKDAVSKKITALREKFGFTDFQGESVEFHDSGCVTFPILGTKANLEDKLKFDPDRSRRRKIYDEVCNVFEDYNVFVGGSSSFDMAPKPYNKYYALAKYCQENNITHDEVVFVGDDYGLGGNDESVFKSDFGFIKVDDYKDFPNLVAYLLK